MQTHTKRAKEEKLANSIEEAARRLDLSVPYLRIVMKQHPDALPVVRFGRAIRILEKDLLTFARRGLPKVAWNAAVDEPQSDGDVEGAVVLAAKSDADITAALGWSIDEEVKRTAVLESGDKSAQFIGFGHPDDESYRRFVSTVVSDVPTSVPDWAKDFCDVVGITASDFCDEILDVRSFNVIANSHLRDGFCLSEYLEAYEAGTLGEFLLRLPNCGTRTVAIITEHVERLYTQWRGAREGGVIE
jgi:hypothetical protein